MTPDAERAGAARDFDVVLVLSGGNALGAFEAGVYEALHEHDLQPDWIIGASIGAINGALITGSPTDRRIETLRTFWRPAPSGAPALPWLGALETSRRTNAVGWSATLGRPGIFAPMLSTLAPWTDSRPSIFETNQLGTTLEKLVDFERLNVGPCRYTATAVDLETGDDVVFDSAAMQIGPDHVRASAALPVAFPQWRSTAAGWSTAACPQTYRSTRFSASHHCDRHSASRSTCCRSTARARRRWAKRRAACRT
ncbi:patatin-like phospholipase family protein [Sphingomonas sp. H160509]|uniref:patatin-like phospholipase family protein n=1 Tax=Sphingomonas sp. H160509 TaxID=2955313 RepID=UPI002096CD39|nr:patatin-like phospholipase family protein [Sphingomonas sp. H160509]